MDYEPTNYTMEIINTINNDPFLDSKIKGLVVSINNTPWPFADKIDRLWNFVHFHVKPQMKKNGYIPPSIMLEMTYIYWYYMTDWSTSYPEWMVTL